MDEVFTVVYKAEDGYIGDRPLKVKIRPSDIEEDMDEKDLVEFLDNAIFDDFEQRVVPTPKNEKEFIEWAKKIIANRTQETEHE